MTKSSSLLEQHGEIPRSPRTIACIVRWPNARSPGSSPRGTADFAIEASSETMPGCKSASLHSISDACSRSGSASKTAGGSLRRSRSSGLTRRERHLWRQAPSSVTGFHPLHAGSSVSHAPRTHENPTSPTAQFERGLSNGLLGRRYDTNAGRTPFAPPTTSVLRLRWKRRYDKRRARIVQSCPDSSARCCAEVGEPEASPI